MDYAFLGFKCGLEIHQRLNTGQKLFCACPSELKEEAPRGELTRRIRAVAGELGQIDPAAAFEAAQGKRFVYELQSHQSCLIEQDEEPPRALNKTAIKATLQVCNALNAKLLDEVHVMRKTVADGSAVSAFQRTALVGINGTLSTSKGPVGIATVCVEEESSGIVEKSAGVSRYRLDRLGIPLVEIATEPVLKDPEHVREAAEKIGLLLRSSEYVQRGLGSIRQDLNVSISGGARVEIKGAQELSEIPLLVENEVRRQKNLLEIREELKRRGLVKVAFSNPHSVTSIFLKAKPFLSDALKKGHVAMAVKLLFCKGLLGKEVMANHRFGSELADYARPYGVKGIIHCDENPATYGLEPEDFLAVSASLDCVQDDGWAVVVADEAVAVSTLRAVFDRSFSESIPKETRRADGSISRFMRPLPGSARMYPETDVMPVTLTEQAVKSAGSLVLFEDRKSALLYVGLNDEMAEKILRSPDARLFQTLSERFAKIEQKTVAWILTDVKTSLRREGVTQPRVEEALALLAEGKITKAAVTDVLKLGAKDPLVALERLAEAASLLRISGTALKQLAGSLSFSFAEIMKRYRLQVDAGELQDVLRSSKQTLF